MPIDDFFNDSLSECATTTLAIGTNVNPSRVYQNDDDGLAEDGVTRKRKFTEVWHSSEASPDRTFSIAWGDYDNDGDLDLAMGTYGIDRLYRNEHGALNAAAPWQSSELRRYANSVAWGDYDRDGRLDLAVGNGCEYKWFEKPNPRVEFVDCYPNQIYHYEGLDSQGAPIFTASWETSEKDPTTSMAWGDVDRNGWLDLAIGNDCSQVQTSKDKCRSILIYSNINGNLQTTATYSSVLTDNTLSIAWGDYNGDGWLDLAVGNGCDSGAQNCSERRNQLYHNISGTLEISPTWTSVEADDTFSVAWGDYDNDGDLDLMTGNQNNAPNRLYRNERGTLSTNGITLTNDSSVSVAWGDYDGDGDLDLATGNYFRPNHIYRNEGSLEADGITPKFTEVWSLFEIDLTSKVAWADYDNDRDLDLLVTSWGGGSRLYRNDEGTLTPNAAWKSVADRTFSIAWGDYDADGDLDLATGQGWVHAPDGTERDIRIFPNTRDAISSTAFLPSSVAPLPLVHLTRPQPPGDANFYSSPNVLSGPITFVYTLTHPFGLPVRQVTGWYSLNGGGNWKKAQPTSITETTNLKTSPTGEAHTYTWDVANSGVLGQSDNVVFRLVAVPAISNTANSIPGPYLYGSYAAATFPFRVRGSQVYVQQETETGLKPAPNSLVYRLPTGTTGKFEPYTDLTGQPFRTDSQGYLQGRGAITPGDRLVALLPITWTDRYTVYYTSATPTLESIEAYTVPAGLGVQPLVVSAANPLILFDLEISLEWDARNDAAFLRQLDRDMQRTSAILYDLSNGQMALGNVRVFQAKENWPFADVLIYASNRIRPNADLGGIVMAEQNDTLSDGTEIASVYLPGQVRLGPTWTRFGNAADSLGDDWPRALAHELGHYLLYLQDNYLGVDKDGFLVDTDCQGSAMTDAYRVDYSEFLTNSVAWQTTCVDTVAARTTGRPDWDSMAKFYHWLDPHRANEGPQTLPLNITKVELIEPAAGGPAKTLAAPFFGLLDEQGQPLQSRQAEGYLIKSRLITGVVEGRPATDVITYAIALGSTDPGLIHARGAEPGDRLCVFDYSAAPMQLGCQKVGQTESILRLHSVADWPPQITLTPVNSQTFNITVTTGLTSAKLMVQIFSEYGPPSLAKPLAVPVTTSDQIITLTEVISTEQPTFNGFIYVWEPGPKDDPVREILVEFALGGDWPGPSLPGYIRGPGGYGGRYYGRPFVAHWGPRRSSWFRRNAPLISGDGQVMIVNIKQPLASNDQYTLQTLSEPPNLPIWLTSVGQAYRFSTEQAVAQNSISFQYLEQDVPAKQEDALNIYYSAGEGQSWSRLETKVFDYRNRASAKMPDNGEGIYALVSTVKIPEFVQGWNQFGYTIPVSRSVITALASISGDYSSIYHYNPITKSWSLYDPTVPPEFDMLLGINTLTDLKFGQGYWINIIIPTTTLYLAVAEAGRLDVSLQDLQALIAATQVVSNVPNPPATYYGWITPTATLSVISGSPVTASIDGKQCGETTVQAYGGQWVYKLQVKSAEEVFGCGAPDRPIKFKLDGQELDHDQLWNNGQAHLLSLNKRKGDSGGQPPTNPSCSKDLLVNGTMDRDEGWKLDLGAVPARYVPDPRGSGRSLFVGLPYSHRWGYRLWSSAKQKVTIPAGQSVTLTLKYLLNVEPRSGWDDQFVAILDQYEQVVKKWYIPRNSAGQWRDFSQDISQYAGQTMQIYVGVTNDGFEGVTSMLVDDVSLCVK